MTIDEIYKQVSEELGIPNDIVKGVYKAYWQFIREGIIKLPLKEDLTKEEFNKLRCNYNIPSIGKLGVTYDRYTAVKKRFEHLTNKKNEAKENKTNG